MTHVILHVCSECAKTEKRSITHAQSGMNVAFTCDVFHWRHALDVQQLNTDVMEAGRFESKSQPCILVQARVNH